MKKQKWAFRKGDVYVRKGDESAKVETPEDLEHIPIRTEISTDAANEFVRTYGERLSNSLESTLPPLAPNGNANETCGPQLIAALLAPKDFFLIGPSGVGKSLHLKHFCLEALKHSELPVLVAAKHFKGHDFLRLIDQAVAPFSTETADALLKAASICGLRVVLVIDGLNECLPNLENLIENVQALRLRHVMRLLLSSQSDESSRIVLDVDRITVAPLTQAHKRFIYCYHAQILLTPEIDYLCRGFSNGYDLAIAGRCHSGTNGNVTRVELYERYCRNSLTTGETVLGALLREIAGSMNQELVNFWARDRFERFSEDFCLSQRTSLELLDRLKSSRLVTLTDKEFEFEHELLFDYFRAEWARRQYGTLETLAQELVKPKNQSLFPFILPRYQEGSSLRVLLHTPLQPETLSEVLLGRCGDGARETLLAECRELISAAASDLTAVTLNVDKDKSEPTKISLFSLTLIDPRLWTTHEILLCDAIALSLEDRELQNDFLGLLDLTQWTLRKKTEELAQRSGISTNNIWAALVGQLGMFTNQQFPFGRITASLRQALMGSHRDHTFSLRDQLLARVERDAADHFSIAILLDGLTYGPLDPSDVDTNSYISVCRLAWESRIYHLRLNALHLLHTIRRYFYPDDQGKLEKIRAFLGELKTQNLFLNSSLLEVQVAYGTVKPVVSVHEITEEMRSVIAEALASTQAKVPIDSYSGGAYGLLSNIFEDIFDGAYYEAYQSLERDEKVALLCLAAQSKCGLTTDWILNELLRFEEKAALPVFQKYASCVDTDSSAPHETAAAYCFGIAGCSQFMDYPPEYAGPDTREHKAWRIAGEILFWSLRSKKGYPCDTDRMDRLWVGLANEAPLGAADALYRMYSGLFLVDSEQKRDFDLIAQWPSSARPLLEESLRGKASLTSLFRWGGNKDEHLVKFVIEALGRIGCDSTIPVLMELSDDPQFGAASLAAIKRIRGSASERRFSS